MRLLACLGIVVAALACAHGQGGRSEGAHAEREESIPGEARQPARFPLAATPSELLLPGAIEKIQDRLAARGYLDRSAKRGHLDVATAASIRRFQSDQNIARTGIPDHETVRRLGLDPEAVFRKAPPQRGDRRIPTCTTGAS